jgi:hypothetical protein
LVAVQALLLFVFWGQAAIVADNFVVNFMGRNLFYPARRVCLTLPVHRAAVKRQTQGDRGRGGTGLLVRRETGKE